MQRKKTVKEHLEENVEKIVNSLGYEFVGLEFDQESGRSVLRVYIDSLGGIIVRDCESVSKKISRFIDEDEIVPDERFFLEVSSPGLNRPLFQLIDYEKYQGKLVKIRLKASVKGQRKFKGTLSGISEGVIHLEDENGEIHNIPFGDILKGNIVFQGDLFEKQN